MSKFLFGPFSFENTCFGPRLYFIFILIPDFIKEGVASKWQRNDKVISWAWFWAQKKSFLMLMGFFDEKSSIEMFFWLSSCLKR